MQVDTNIQSPQPDQEEVKASTPKSAGRKPGIKNQEKPTEEQQTNREGLRQKRKSTEFFQPEVRKSTEEIEFYQGKGLKLEEIPNVAFRISKMKPEAEELSILHSIAYKKPGKASKRKKGVLQFSGLPEIQDIDKKVSERLERVVVKDLDSLLTLFDLPRTSIDKDATKAKKIDRLVDFLIKPEVRTEKDLVAQNEKKKQDREKKIEKKKKKSSQGKRKSTPSKGVKKSTTPKKKATPKKTPAKKSSKKDEILSESEDEGDDKSDMDVEDQEEEEVQEPQPKKRKSEVEAPKKEAKQKLPSNKVLAKSIERVIKESKDLEHLSNVGLLKELGKEFKMDFKPIKAEIKALALEAFSKLKSDDVDMEDAAKVDKITEEKPKPLQNGSAKKQQEPTKQEPPKVQQEIQQETKEVNQTSPHKPTPIQVDGAKSTEARSHHAKTEVNNKHEEVSKPGVTKPEAKLPSTPKSPPNIKTTTPNTSPQPQLNEAQTPKVQIQVPESLPKVATPKPLSQPGTPKTQVQPGTPKAPQTQVPQPVGSPKSQIDMGSPKSGSPKIL